MPESDAFVVGYETCQVLFFGDGVDDTPIDTTQVVNPFKEGTDQYRGFEQAYYDFTQK